jgi:flagellar basal-body rod protein FlgF
VNARRPTLARRHGVTAEIHQGMLEGSNVVSVTELTQMLDIVRRYESAQKILDSEHDRARRAIDRLARVA